MFLVRNAMRAAWRFHLIRGTLMLLAMTLSVSCAQEELTCEEVSALCLSKLSCDGERKISTAGCGCECVQPSAARSDLRVSTPTRSKRQKTKLPKKSQGTGDKQIKSAVTKSNPSTMAPWQKSLPLDGQSIVASVDALPPAERVFALDEDGDGIDELFGAIGETLWRYSLKDSTLRRETHHGSGTVQRMMVAPWLGKRHVFLAKGRGRGLQGSVSVQLRASNALSFNVDSLYVVTGKRNDVSGLSFVSSMGDKPGGVVLTSFLSKYQVRTLLIGPEPHLTVLHEPQRMAMNVLPWDVGGDAGLYKVVGRIYGDARGEPGDLKIASLGLPTRTDDEFARFAYRTQSTAWRTVPIEGGVRAMVLADTKGTGSKRLYVSDGWSAEYKKKAKAQLKEVRFADGGFQINVIGSSKSEYTFFELWNRDLDGDGTEEIIARGDSHLTYFKRTAEGWRQKRLASYEPVINVALVNRGRAGWFVAIPHAKRTKLTPLSNSEMAL